MFFSEYIEGSSNNKALEIFNGTGGTVNLATQGYNVQIFFNGASTAGLTINLTGTVNYNAEFKSPNQVNTLSAANAFRSADHDPLIVGLNLNAPRGECRWTVFSECGRHSGAQWTRRLSR